MLLGATDTRGLFVLIRMVLSPSESVPTHGREDRLLFVQDGCMEVCVGAQTFELGAGDIALLPRGVSHFLSTTRNSRAIALCWMFGGRAEETLLAEERALMSESDSPLCLADVPTAKFKVVRADEENSRKLSDEKIRVLVTPSETDGRFCVVKIHTPPLGGSVLRVHERQDKTFLVYAGRYELCLADARVVAKTGDLIWVPRGVPHAWRAVSSAPGRIVALSTPGML
jgi:quercetin dioxygenase-like cupin family protein